MDIISLQTLWVVASIIIGWWAPEIIASVTNTKWPILANVSFAFVGGLIAHTIFM